MRREIIFFHSHCAQLVNLKNTGVSAVCLAILTDRRQQLLTKSFLNS